MKKYDDGVVSWGAVLGLALVLLVGVAVAQQGLDRHVIPMSAASLTNFPTGSFTHTGGGYLRVLELTSLWNAPDTTNASYDVAVQLELAPGVSRTLTQSLGPGTNELGVATNILWHVTVAPPTNRLIALPEPLYLFSGQKLDLQIKQTNIVDHPIFMIFER